MTSLHYIASNGKWYSRKETPSEYKRRNGKNNGGDPNTALGCLFCLLVMIILCG